MTGVFPYKQAGTAFFNHTFGAVMGFLALHALGRGILSTSYTDCGSSHITQFVQHDTGPSMTKTNRKTTKPIKLIKPTSKYVFVAQLYDFPYNENELPKRLDWLIRKKPRVIMFHINAKAPQEPQLAYFNFLTECIFHPKRARTTYPNITERMPDINKFNYHKYRPRKLVLTVNQAEDLTDDELNAIIYPYADLPYIHNQIGDHGGLQYTPIQIWGTVHKTKVIHNNRPYFKTQLKHNIMLNRDEFMKTINPHVI